MGSEQSTRQGSRDSRTATRTGQLRRGKSVPESSRPQDVDPSEISRPGSCSPGLSVCSDSDLPYIPYTVNRPIGDSPKLPTKQSQLIRGKSLGAAGILLSQSKKMTAKKSTPIKTGHNIVVVKAAVKEETTEEDQEVKRLKEIPTFLPIIRETVNVPGARDPEVLERLDHKPLYKLCYRYQTHLTECASLVSDEQTPIFKKIKEIDEEISKLKNNYNERYRTHTKHVETLSKLQELSAQIEKCQAALNKALGSVERLNNELPIEERLEPFVWTTG